MDLDLTSAIGRYAIRLSSRWHLVVMVPLDGVLVLGVFVDGRLVHVIDEPAGEA